MLPALVKDALQECGIGRIEEADKQKVHNAIAS